MIMIRDATWLIADCSFQTIKHAEDQKKQGMTWIGRQCAHLFTQLDCKETEAKLVYLVMQQHESSTATLRNRVSSLRFVPRGTTVANTILEHRSPLMIISTQRCFA